MSISGLGSRVNRMMAENAIESDESNRLIRQSGYAQSQAALQVRNAKKKSANDMQSAAGWVQVASSAASTAKAAVGAGQAAQDHQQFQATEPQLSDATQRAQAGDTAGLQDVLDTRLGEGGPTVQERFGEGATRRLMSDDIGAQAGETREAWNARVGDSLQQAGFTEGEVDQIYAKAKDGSFSTDDAVGFMWQNRQDPAEAQAKNQRDAAFDEIRKQISQFVDRGAAEAGRHVQNSARDMDGLAQEMSEVAHEAHEQAVQHNEAIGEISLQNLRERLGLASARDR